MDTLVCSAGARNTLGPIMISGNLSLLAQLRLSLAQHSPSLSVLFIIHEQVSDRVTDIKNVEDNNDKRD